MITRKTDNTIIENLNIISCIDNNEVVFYEAYPEEGYIIRTPIFDEIIEDESGKKFLSLGYAAAMTESATYNWVDNPNNYSVEPYKENELIEYEANEADYINALEKLGVSFNE